MNTLIDCLERSAKFSLNESARGITIIEGKDNQNYISYQELRDIAKRIAIKLQSINIKKNDYAIFQIDDIQSFLYLFWGCIYAGIIPVPLSGSKDRNIESESLIKLKNVSHQLKNHVLFVNKEKKEFYEKNYSIPNEKIISVESLLIDLENNYSSGGLLSSIEAEDIAFIQYSSGSTGSPKGVILSHNNLITNMKQILNHLGLSNENSSCSWMPLTHDMGIIGFHLSPMMSLRDQTLFSPEFFIRYPIQFLHYISENKISFLGLPNFSIEWILKFYNKDKMEGVDFSSVECILNGAEPINCETTNRFITLMAEHGLSKTALRPAYGMAEACVAIAIADKNEFSSVNLNRHEFSRNNKVKFEKELNDNVQQCAVIGNPLQGIEIRIMDENNQILENNEIGEILIRGNNVFKGYFQIERSLSFTNDGFFRTGDVGFLSNQGLVITGRLKDIIYKNGSKYYSHDIERIITDIIPKFANQIAVVQACDVDNRQILILFYRLNISQDELEDYKKKIDQVLIQKLGTVLDKFIKVKSIPKTTSGKLKRYQLQKEFESGLITE